MQCENLKCNNELSHLQEKSGIRFCCRACSNATVKRLANVESRQKMAASLSATRKASKVEHPLIDKICEECGQNFSATFQRRHVKTCSARCNELLRAKRAAKTKTLNDTHSGWHNRKGEPSYPEKYFISVFENEGISGWNREQKVGRWFVDFAFSEKMIAVEIDGRQHQDEKRRNSDLLKDEFLTSLGWKVIRIPWVNPTSEKNKQILHSRVKELLEILQ